MRNPLSENAMNIALADALADKLKHAAEQTPEARGYNRAMINYANIVKSVTKTGTLAEKIEVERALLERDLLNAGADQKLRKEAESAIANFNRIKR